jgi:hypothetical protein
LTIADVDDGRAWSVVTGGRGSWLPLVRGNLAALDAS